MYRDKISPLLYKKEINMDHIKVEKEFLDNLFESAAWNQVGVKPVVEEAAPEGNSNGGDTAFKPADLEA